MAETVVIDFQSQIDGINKANSALDQLGKTDKKNAEQFKKSNQDYQKEIANSNKATNDFVGTLKNVGAAVGVAFGAQQLIAFGKEAVQLALKAEGIKGAFDRLNSPHLLDNLRKATKGTVSDLELMRNAVVANNFQIPLDKLASLFKFASQRARETGESVDYLVQSIVTGIARKSPLILDNLGINIKRINEEFDRTGDFASAAMNVVNEELTKQGTAVETNAEKVDRLSARWENFKRSAGEALIAAVAGVVDLDDAIDDLANKLTPERFQRPGASVVDKKTLEADRKRAEEERLATIEVVQEELREIARLRKEAGANQKELDEQEASAKLYLRELTAEKVVAIESKTLQKLREQLERQKEILAGADIGSDLFKKTADTIRDLQKQIDDATGKTLEEQQKKNKEADEKYKRESLEAEKEFQAFLLEIDKINNDAKLQAARDFQKNLVNLDDETLKQLLENRQIDEVTYQDALDKKRELAEADYKEARERYDANSDLIKKRVQEEEEAAKREMELAREVAEERMALQNAFIQLIEESFSLQSELIDNQAAKELRQIDNRKEAEVLALENLLEKKIITEDEFNKRRLELDTETEAKALGVKRRAAEGEKRIKIFEILIQTAVNVTKALGELKFPANIALGVAYTAIGLVQAQKVKNSPIPFAKGTKSVPGGEPGKDSVHALLMPEEMVVPVVKKRKYATALNAIFDEKIAPDVINEFVRSALSGGVHVSPNVSARFDEYLMGRIYSQANKPVVRSIDAMRRDLHLMNRPKLVARREAWG